jgi:L-ectoine synthase
MKIVEEFELIGSERDVDGIGFKSLRYLLASDNMGFSLHKTIIPKGGPYYWHYKKHFEACFCVSGEGMLYDMVNKRYYSIKPNTTYVLDKNDPHTFEALTDVVLISIFNPPVTGREIHKEDGSYE